MPSLEELERLTAVPDRRVVFRGVDWSFYEQLVDSIPEWSNIHVDYDGKDLEVMRQRSVARRCTRSCSGEFVEVIAEELAIPYASDGPTTWKRPEIRCGLEADAMLLFLAREDGSRRRGPETSLRRHRRLSQPRPGDRGRHLAAPGRSSGNLRGIGVAEVWRFDGDEVVIERLTPREPYTAVEPAAFCRFGPRTCGAGWSRRTARDESAWARRLRAEIRSRMPS